MNVEAVSLRRRGIKLDGKWYNYPERLDRIVRNIKKGDNIEIKLSDDKKTITFIQPVKTGLKHYEGNKDSAYLTTQNQKLKFMALSLAVETAKAILELPEGENSIKGLVDNILQIADVYVDYLKE